MNFCPRMIKMGVPFVVFIILMNAVLILSQDKSVAQQCAELEGSSEKLDAMEKYGKPAVKLIRYSLGYTFIGVEWHLGESDAVNVCSFTVHVWRADDTNRALLSKNSHNATTKTWLIEGLQPGTTYEIIVETLYVSQHAPVSWTLRSTTLACNCHAAGTEPNKLDSCNTTNGQCECKNANTIGQRCEGCYVGFYMHEVYGCTACDQCPPAVYGGNGSCVYHKEDIMRCVCMQGYKGKHCDQCADDHYAQYTDDMQPGSTRYTLCTKCDCSQNTNKTQVKACYEKTGNCQGCLFTTTGPVCTYCLSQYSGNSLNETCLNMIGISTSSSTVIIVFIVILILCLSAVIIVIYRKYLLHRKARNFLQTRMKQEHDHVKFSAMMEEPEDTLPAYKM